VSRHIGFKDFEREIRAFRERLSFSKAAMVVLTLVLVGRLAWLQIVDHSHYTTLSTDNRLKLTPLPPARGLVYSRDGVLLAENVPTFDLELTPERLTDATEARQVLAGVIHLEEEERARLERTLTRKNRRFESYLIKSDLDENDIAQISLVKHRLPGFEIVPHLTRHYPLGALLAHVVGYVGRIDARELERLDASDYTGSKFIGKTGVEFIYESQLHGHAGYQQEEVNARGRPLRILERVPPEPGKDIYLTIDTRLQRVATEAMGEHNGALVAIEIATGGVLASVSVPSFNPDLFVHGINKHIYKALLEAPDRPLFNRAVQGQYPPGSTIKPMVALAGLEYRLRTPADRIHCPGYFTLKDYEHRYHDWLPTGHGYPNMRDALAQSCDVYFYKLASDMGIDRLHRMLSTFGLGRRTGVDLPGEAAGVLPSRAWKMAHYKRGWYPGETLITGIGQGYMLVTPMQLAYATALLAGRGSGTPPHVIGQIEDTVSRNSLDPVADERLQVQTTDPLIWDEVIQGMVDVVHGPMGTARQMGKDAPYRIAGKTGTAQVQGLKGEGSAARHEEAEGNIQDHALFIAFAPAEAPRIAIAVIIEHGGSGSKAAAPVARQVLDRFLAVAPRMEPQVAPQPGTGAGPDGG
jgi:penicillin-binding protein 2